MRFLVILTGAILALLGAGMASGQIIEESPPIEDADGDGIEDSADHCPRKPGYERHDGCPKRYVVNSWVKKPKRHIYRKRRFTPAAHPSPRKVTKIINLEYKRWGGRGPIHDRVWCESRNIWNATNGQYHGLIQASYYIFGYMSEGMPRRVVVRVVKKRKRPVWFVRVYNTGKKTWTKRRMRTQYVHVKRVGRLPRKPDPYHGWMAIRVGQRAVAGYRTTYWACPSNGSHY